MSNDITTVFALRGVGADTKYWENQCKQFASGMLGLYKDVESVRFGKSDSRGSFSIDVQVERGRVISQRLFKTKNELLAFVEGYNRAMRGGKL